MQEHNLLTPGVLVLRGILIFATLVIALGMTSPVAQAQNDAGYVVLVNPLRTDYCPKDKETYHLHVGIIGSIGPHDPLERSYVQIKPGIVGQTDITPPSIGAIIGSTIIQKYSPTPDLAIGDTIDFTFQAGAEGSGMIIFSASVDGTQAKPFPVGVVVHACQYEVSGESHWNLPFGGGDYQLTLKLNPVMLMPGTTKGTVSGQGTAVWQPDASGPPCAFPYKIAPSKVTINGTLADDGSLKQLTMTYGSVAQTETANCVVAATTHTHTISFTNLKFKPVMDQPNPVPHAITSPATVKGTATIYVHLVPSDLQ